MIEQETSCGAYHVTEETLDTLFSLWRQRAMNIDWNPLFVVPPWLSAWGNAFACDGQPLLLAVRHGSEIIGIAPYAITGDRASFWGSGDVCDYMDVVAVPGREQEFFSAVLAHVRHRGVRRLSFQSLRPDSVTMTYLPGIVESLGGTVDCEEEDVSLGLYLPPTWNDYLMGLNGKERHEVRRKLRRLYESGQVRLRGVCDGTLSERDCELFLRIFTANRSDKAQFMTPRMVSFFRNLAVMMARENLLRLFFLELDDTPVATVLCFDYGSTRYLYNSGYVDTYRHLSAGLLCKILSIKDGIERQINYYDFLKGSEPYKSRLGGKVVQLFRCSAAL